ncbi:ABCG2 [Mytilus coruscus]|uniref:ABCG2 n=1 Tax=Mytilus coruscus TaxID=42192 RepID=A0A6J8D3C2_MYTCO|nr:ABCG2 [Mytilus coruscus]
MDIEAVEGSTVEEASEDESQKKRTKVKKEGNTNTKLRLQNVIKPILNQYHQAFDTNTLNMSPKVEYATSFFKQFRVISSRTLLNLLRNPQLSILHVSLTLDEEKFFLYALTLFTVAMTGTSIAFFFSACVTDFGMANVWIAVTYVLMMALEIIELKDMTFTNGTVLW